MLVTGIYFTRAIVCRSNNNGFNNTDNHNSQSIHIDMLGSMFDKGNMG